MKNNLSHLKFDWEDIKAKYGYPVTNDNKNIYQNIFYNFSHQKENHIPDTLEAIIYKKREIPTELKSSLDLLINEFRNSFPKSERDNTILKEGFYFDDRIEDIIQHNQNIIDSDVLYDVLKLEHQAIENEQKYRITEIATKEDEQTNSYLKKGEKYTRLRDFNTFEEGLNYIQEVDSISFFRNELWRFHKTYGDGTKAIFRQEIEKINDFIKETDNIDIQNAFKKWFHNDDLLEYVRITNNYYLNKYNKYYKNSNHFYPSTFFEGRYAPVYARYFLYKKWLENKLGISNNLSIENKEVSELKIDSPEHLEVEKLISELKLDDSLEFKLVRRLGELFFCKNHLPNLVLSSIVLTGSILEGVLLGLATKEENLHVFNKSSKCPKDENGKPKKHQNWSFKDFIDVSKDINLLNDSYTNAVEIMEKRNYIHPHKEFKSNNIYSTHYQDETYSDLKLVLKEISRNLHVLKQV